jgi:hypothetical protein
LWSDGTLFKFPTEFLDRFLIAQKYEKRKRKFLTDAGCVCTKIFFCCTTKIYFSEVRHFSSFCLFSIFRKRIFLKMWKRPYFRKIVIFTKILSKNESSLFE